MIPAARDAATTADRILTRAEKLFRSLHAGDDAALLQARELRSTLDGLINRLTLAQFAPMAQARADLARILTAMDAKRGGK